MKKVFSLVTGFCIATAAHASYSIMALPTVSGITGTPYAYCISNLKAGTGTNRTAYVTGYWSTSTNRALAKWSLAQTSSTATPTAVGSTASPLSGYANMVGYGVNNLGQIVGECDNGSSFNYHDEQAFYLPNTGSAGLLPSYFTLGQEYVPTIGYSIDDFGDVTGSGTFFSTSAGHLPYPNPKAFYWTTGGTTTTPLMNMPSIMATIGYHVSNTGGVTPTPLVTGVAQKKDSAGNIYLVVSNADVAAGTMLPEGEVVSTDPGYYTTSWGNNPSGEYVGSILESTSYPIYGSGASATKMSFPGEALSINASHNFVGYKIVSGVGERAFMSNTSTGLVTDLTTVANSITGQSGWVLQRAYSINDSGWIVGIGSHNGASVAFLLWQ